MFETATSALGWSPSVFWDATWWEYSHALVGHMKYHQKGKWGKEALNHWNNQDYLAAKKELAEINNRRYTTENVPPEIRKRLKEKRGVKSSR